MIFGEQNPNRPVLSLSLALGLYIDTRLNEYSNRRLTISSKKKNICCEYNPNRPVLSLSLALGLADVHLCVIISFPLPLGPPLQPHLQ